MVQEQWLQLKLKFLLGYNMKIVTQQGVWAFGGKNKILVEGFYWGVSWQSNEQIFKNPALFC